MRCRNLKFLPVTEYFVSLTLAMELNVELLTGSAAFNSGDENIPPFGVRSIGRLDMFGMVMTRSGVTSVL